MNRIKILLIGTFIFLSFGVILTSCGGSGSSDSGSVTSSHWARSYYTGYHMNVSRSSQQTDDNGYIFGGSTGSGRKDDSSNFWLIKLNAYGDVSWSKILDREGYGDGNRTFSLQQSGDGGYVVSGNSSWLWGDLIIKLDSDGSIVWQKLYSDGGFINRTYDGGYIVGGNYCIFKIDSIGNILWQKTYGGFGGIIKQTKDGGYIVERNLLNNDVEVIKLDSNGVVTWAKGYAYAGTSFDIHETADGGYIFGGGSLVDVLFPVAPFFVKIDSMGNIMWAKAVVDGSIDYLASIKQTGDGGYLVSGSTNKDTTAIQDIWVSRLNQGGEVLWQKTYGGTSLDFASSAIETSDSNYVVFGGTDSFGKVGDAYWDLWVLKLRPDGTVSPTAPSYIGADAHAVIGDISISVYDTNTTPADWTVTVSDVSVKSIDANVTVQTQASD